MPLVAVAPNKFQKAFDGVRAHVPERFQVLELEDALHRVYSTDAHLVTYVVEGRQWQPRIKKAGLPSFHEPVHVGVLFCDVDNPGHAPWNDEYWAEAERQWASLDVLGTVGAYATRHGRRFVQPLKEPVPVAEAERYIAAWLLMLTKAGLPVDMRCKDWTRHYRLPNVVRDGVLDRSPILRLERMRPIAITPVDAPPPKRGARAPRAPKPVEPVDALPAQFERYVAPLGDAIRLGVGEGFHSMYLALGGALLRRGVPPEALPPLIFQVAVAAGSSKPPNHEQGARDTAANFVAGNPVTGLPALEREWPRVAEALRQVTAGVAEARLRAALEAPPPAPTRPLPETLAALRDALRKAPDGLSLVAAQCGLGKTRAAIDVAAERAQRPKGLHTKTAISVDKHALALQVAADVATLGVPVKRLFGPLSLKEENGDPVCRYHDVALPLVAGGQTMQWELCLGRKHQRCEHFESCRAKDGFEGPPNARVVVGPHALLPMLDAEAGKTGLLVIDEPPPALNTELLTREEIAVALDTLGAFEGRFAGAITPALEALSTFAALGEGAVPLADAVRSAAPDPKTMAQARRSAALGDDADAVACAREARLADEIHRAPPLTFAQITLAKANVAHAKTLGTASRVLRVLHRGLLSDAPVVARADTRGVLVTMANENLAAALKREGQVVVTDANAELHRAVYAKIVDYEPPFHAFAAPDGAPIERTLLRTGSANRKAWIPHRQLTVAPSLVAAVKAVFAWASGSKLGIISVQTVELALRAAAGQDVDHEWKRLQQSPEVLREVVEVLGPIVKGFAGELVFGHYGALRGLDAMADVDCLATLGDPWLNLADAQNDVAFLGLEEPWEERYEALCRAELEQAHGRIRAVHRTRPGRALHVGAVPPSGAGWCEGQVVVRELGRGRPKAEAAMTAEELGAIVAAHGGVRAAARAAECSPGVLSERLAGKGTVSAALADRIRSVSPAK